MTDFAEGSARRRMLLALGVPEQHANDVLADPACRPLIDDLMRVVQAAADSVALFVREAHTENLTPLERLQICPDEALIPSPDTPQTQVQSESRHPDSNRGPLHYESKQPDHPRPQTTTQSGDDGAAEDDVDPAGQPKRLQNASSPDHDGERRNHASSDADEDELRDWDPTEELGGGPCERCGREQEAWRYSRLCQACIWDEASAP